MYTEFAIILIISLAPVALLLWYFDRLDKKSKESRRFLWSIFLWGVLVTFAAGGIEVLLEYFFGGLFIDPWLKIFITAFVFIALVEEGLKFFIVKKKAYPHPAYNEYYDGVIYAVVASLGFAALENIFYVAEGGLGVGVIRAILSVPAHALFGAVMGYFMALAKFSANKNEEKKYLYKAVLIPFLLHGFYDFLLMSSTVYSMLVFPFLLGLYLYVKRKINRLHVLDKTAEPLKSLKIVDYIKILVGLGFFTFGALAIFVVILFITGDADVKSSLKGVEFDTLTTSAFGFIMMFISLKIIKWSYKK
ncbi:PrsW family intramembrane metalloprotease [Candidatus Peregrinibacteria bacterium]|nr:PrsW family intramembrane metalloprotease [Candidatus Peregrinibacteria bacterium]